MKKHDPLELQINKIMKEATEASNIVIYCEKSTTTNSKAKVDELFVESINGFKKLGEFEDSLEKIGMGIARESMKKQANKTDVMKFKFINRLKNSISELQCNVIKESNNNVSIEFKNPVIMIGTLLSTDKAVNDTVIEIVKQYASSWNYAFKTIKRELSILELIFEYTEKGLSQGGTEKNRKIETDLTIARFSSLFRLFYDREMFGTMTKMEVCTLLTNYFSTRKNPVMSKKYFRNHFDVPDADSLAYWEDTFGEMKKEIRNYYDKYHSN